MLYAILHPHSFSLELPDFPGCEMYQHLSKQYFEIVFLMLLREMIHMVSLIDTEWFFLADAGQEEMVSDMNLFSLQCLCFELEVEVTTGSL